MGLQTTKPEAIKKDWKGKFDPFTGGDQIKGELLRISTLFHIRGVTY
jgi:hypothetical protein